MASRGKKKDEEDRTTLRKRRRDGRSGGSTSLMLRRHLYLVLDDWPLGYSIRKVDLCDHPQAGEQCLLSLPPAIIRGQAQRGASMYFMAAFGSSIMAMYPYDTRNPQKEEDFFAIFDVHERSLSFCPQIKEYVLGPIFIPVGNKLFALGGSFQVLDHPPQDETCVPWAWRRLPDPPFEVCYITCYAVHPDGHIFVSIGGIVEDETFSISVGEDMDEGATWALKGEWALPFTGRVHYDSGLNAWVGFSADPARPGYLCTCDVASVDPGECPAGKLGKEFLFTTHPNDLHVGATLVPMEAGNFCLVECISFVPDVRDDPTVPPRRRSLLKMTTFSLEYDENGDLTTGNTRRVRRYDVPEKVSSLHLTYPAAFWL